MKRSYKVNGKLALNQGKTLPVAASGPETRRGSKAVKLDYGYPFCSRIAGDQLYSGSFHLGAPVPGSGGLQVLGEIDLCGNYVLSCGP